MAKQTAHRITVEGGEAFLDDTRKLPLPDGDYVAVPGRPQTVVNEPVGTGGTSTRQTITHIYTDSGEPAPAPAREPGPLKVPATKAAPKRKKAAKGG